TAYPRAAGTVNSQAVEATWTDEPVNNSQDRARIGAAPAGGARTTALTRAATVRRTVAQSHARDAVTPTEEFGVRCIGKRDYGSRLTGKALPRRWWLRHLGDPEPRDDQFGQLLPWNPQPGEPKLPDRRALEAGEPGADRGAK